MSSLFRTFAIAVALVTALSASTAAALDRYVSRGPGKLVISGYDTTAYFKRGNPQRGKSAHTVRWQGVTWRFATAAEAATFRANPGAYAPQFGAYCTGGLSQHHAVTGNPRIWRLYKGKLYLFASYAGGRRFDRDPDGVIARAWAYWKTLNIKQ